MQFKSKFAAYRAMVLSDILSQIYPDANQIFLDNGDIRVKRVTVRLNPKGKLVLLEKKSYVRPLEEAVITSNAAQFAAKGDVWNARNEQVTAYSHVHIRTDPDGTRIFPENEKPTVDGYDDWGVIPLPPRVADPVPAVDDRKAQLRARINRNLTIIHAARSRTVRVKG